MSSVTISEPYHLIASSWTEQLQCINSITCTLSIRLDVQLSTHDTRVCTQKYITIYQHLRYIVTLNPYHDNLLSVLKVQILCVNN